MASKINYREIPLGTRIAVRHGPDKGREYLGFVTGVANDSIDALIFYGSTPALRRGLWHEEDERINVIPHASRAIRYEIGIFRVLSSVEIDIPRLDGEVRILMEGIDELKKALAELQGKLDDYEDRLRFIEQSIFEVDGEDTGS